jgi:hypothetical protein
MIINGKVYNRTNNAAIVGARVYISDAAAVATGIETVTNAEGKFTIETGSGTHVASSAKGFTTKAQSIQSWQYLNSSMMYFALDEKNIIGFDSDWFENNKVIVYGSIAAIAIAYLAVKYRRGKR